MARVKITIDDKNLNKKIQQAMKVAPKETTRAMTDCVLDLAGESAKRAPIESGDLRNNCHAKLNNATIYENQSQKGVQVAGNLKATGEVGYSLPYAARQHEDLTMRHDRTDGYRIMSGKNAGQTVNMVAGGEAKFLERPFRERKQRYINRFKQIIARCLK
ncbi:hypothetical protein GC105_09115 [Alkalibaculum sp. M08DMB]|uniref:HK97 gp10 family phage protein n=1 Tax=Alkalibaculum sporogenes TaxID=2655001 RepID=A0A6A7K8W5_9FIRM|nr:hypothetical protein [Alkalibaculum sporogenes]MPW25949.1 hypothetical protein [Alkalibaculum sporogenes]